MTLTVGEALDLARYSLVLIIEISAPVLLVGMVVGLVISLLQAVTQLQEQTLSFVPKMLAMAIAAVVFLPWITTKVLDFTYSMFTLGLE